MMLAFIRQRVGVAKTVLLLATLSLLGCDPGFSKISEVEKLRILAIRVERPDLLPGESTEISALVVTPDDGQVELSWELCPFLGGLEDDYECQDLDGIPPEFLEQLSGSGERFDFEYAVALFAMLAPICEQQAEAAELLPAGVSLPGCLNGFPMNVRVTARALASGEEVSALKKIYLGVDPLHFRANTNPSILELAPTPEAPATASAGSAFPVRCEVDPESVVPIPEDEDASDKGETIRLRWYARNGSVDKESESWATDYVEPEEHFHNEVTPDGRGAVTVWCVIGDGRGGTDWRHLEIAVE